MGKYLVITVSKEVRMLFELFEKLSNRKTSWPNKNIETKPVEGAPKITKKAMIEQLLKSDNGATIDDIVKQTSWQKHTVRGHLSILKKAGAEIISECVDGVRRYFCKT